MFEAICFLFFFSSRRRHTRWNCDWSSDVCSSDLNPSPQARRPCSGCQSPSSSPDGGCDCRSRRPAKRCGWASGRRPRSEEHTSELQSQFHLVCRLLLEKKKKKNTYNSDNNTVHSS